MAKPPIRKPKKKVCVFCKEKIQYVDYKDTGLLRKFISDRGKIRARRVSGNRGQHPPGHAVARPNSPARPRLRGASPRGRAAAPRGPRHLPPAPARHRGRRPELPRGGPAALHLDRALSSTVGEL